jgi:hypothetical protein
MYFFFVKQKKAKNSLFKHQKSCDFHQRFLKTSQKRAINQKKRQKKEQNATTNCKETPFFKCFLFLLILPHCGKHH